MSEVIYTGPATFGQGVPTPLGDLALHGIRNDEGHVQLKPGQNAFDLVLELPGLSEKDVHVKAYDREIEIKAEKAIVQSNENKHETDLKYYRRVAFPYSIDRKKIKAVMDHGVLTITVPLPSKSELAQTGPEIPISKL